MPCRELHAKFLPADEGCPQGPRTHHTRTMRAFSSASTAQLTCPPRHTRYKTRPARRKTPNLGTFSRAGRIFIHACVSNKPSMRISLAHAASFEARHTAADLHTPTWQRPSSAGEARHKAADLHAPNPTTVDESGCHRQDRDERKYAHA